MERRIYSVSGRQRSVIPAARPDTLFEQHLANLDRLHAKLPLENVVDATRGARI